MDTTPPDLTTCPSDVHKSTEIGTPRVQVSWDEPSVTDKSGYVKLVNATHTSGDIFDVGSTRVSYTFSDRASNRASCDFTVTVFEGTCINFCQSFFDYLLTPYYYYQDMNNHVIIFLSQQSLVNYS